MTTPEPLSGLVVVMLSFLRNLAIAGTLFASQCHDCQVCSRNRYKPDQRGAPSVNRVALCLQPHGVTTVPQSDSNSVKVCSLLPDFGGKPKLSPCVSTNRSKFDSSYSERFQICCSVSLKALPKHLLLS